MAIRREDADFESEGTRCAAWLYREEAADDPPVVVLADAFGTERSWGAPAFAERFAGRGLAVLSFDYRRFGDSDGEPRNLITPTGQVRDCLAAIRHARALDGVDGTRLGLWGCSFGGGHAISAAARDGDVDALVCQVPFSDGLRTELYLARQGGIGYAVGAVVATLRDLGRAVTGRPPYYVPIAARPTEFGALNSPGSLDGYESIAEADWDNRCPARIFLTALSYRPVRQAHRVTCPTLVVEAEADAVIPPASVDRLVRRLGNAERVRLPIGHFDVYTGDSFRTVVDREAAFLCEHLLD